MRRHIQPHILEKEGDFIVWEINRGTHEKDFPSRWAGLVSPVHLQMVVEPSQHLSPYLDVAGTVIAEQNQHPPGSSHTGGGLLVQTEKPPYFVMGLGDQPGGVPERPPGKPLSRVPGQNFRTQLHLLLILGDCRLGFPGWNIQRMHLQTRSPEQVSQLPGTVADDREQNQCIPDRFFYPQHQPQDGPAHRVGIPWRQFTGPRAGLQTATQNPIGRNAESVDQFLREAAAQDDYLRVLYAARSEGEMSLDQFEEPFRFLEWRHFPHQPLRNILMFRFIGGNLFFLQLHTGCLLLKKSSCLCAAGHRCHRQDVV